MMAKADAPALPGKPNRTAIVRVSDYLPGFRSPDSTGGKSAECQASASGYCRSSRAGAADGMAFAQATQSLCETGEP
jgi:hypothetical protein